MTTPRGFQDSARSYLFVVGLGVLAGIVTRLADLCPFDTLWSFSSIASAFGFWMVTTTLVILFSCSNKNAAINVFLYLSSMNFTFYFLQYVLGLYFPRFHNVTGFAWGLLRTFDLLALACAAIGYVLYFWNRETVLSSVLYALPICGLGAEAVGVAVFLFDTHTYLFQLIFDLVGFAVLGAVLYRRATHRWVYVLTVVVGSAVGYLLLYSSVL